jgi:hypothetical protein
MGKMSTPKGSRSSPAGLGTLGPAGRGCPAPGAGRGVPGGARLGGRAASRRLPNAEVKAVWAGSPPVGAWAGAGRPHPGPTPRPGNRPWARGFERPVANVAPLHIKTARHRARTTRQDASSARGAPDPVRSRALNEGAARSGMGRPRQRAVAPASGRPRATDCPPFSRSAAHLRVGPSWPRGLRDPVLHSRPRSQRPLNTRCRALPPEDSPGRQRARAALVASRSIESRLATSEVVLEGVCAWCWPPLGGQEISALLGA